MITVELLDDAGTLVPNADVTVSLSVTGPAEILGTTNGDPASHVQASSPQLPTFHGLLRGFLRSAKPGATGTIVVTAKAAGVTSDFTTLRAL